MGLNRKAKRQEYMRAYYAKNREKLNAYAKAYRLAHPDAWRKYREKNHEKHKEYMREYMRAWRAKNRESYNQYYRERYHRRKAQGRTTAPDATG